MPPKSATPSKAKAAKTADAADSKTSKSASTPASSKAAATNTSTAAPKRPRAHKHEPVGAFGTTEIIIAVVLLLASIIGPAMAMGYTLPELWHDIITWRPPNAAQTFRTIWDNMARDSKRPPGAKAFMWDQHAPEGGAFQ